MRITKKDLQGIISATIRELESRDINCDDIGSKSVDEICNKLWIKEVK